MNNHMFYHKQPKKFNRVHWIMKETGWTPKPWYWCPGTKLDFEDQGPGINRHCKDVSKSHVDRIFTEVFGYSSFVDENGSGRAVIKSERNAAHDGRIVELPYDLQEGEVCQRFIDTKSKRDGYHRELRTLIVESRPVCVLVKKKENAFNSIGCSFKYSEKEFPKWWADKIEEFCQKLGLDYGELDILSDGDYYITDANNCPGGMSKRFLDQPEQELNFFIECHRPLFKHT